MIVKSITSVRLPLRLVDPLRTSHGTHAKRVASLVSVTTSEGIIGWGEDVSPSGVAYVGESSNNSFSSLRELSGIAGRRSIDVAEMFSETWWGVDGRPFAKHALESALWDAHARTRGVSLASLLGGTESSVTPGVVIGIHDSVEELEASVLARIAEGYRRIKLKIEPSRDLAFIAHVRSVVGSDYVLQVDANGAYTRADMNTLCQLENFGVQFIEQPFAAHDFESHAALAKSTSTPVCLDESIMNLNDLQMAIDTGACSVVNIKPSRLGGLCDALRLHDVASSHGLDTWVGGMSETGIGRASCLAFASRPGFSLTPDLSASNRYFDQDVTEPFVLSGGQIAVPSALGIGVEPLPWVFEHPDVKIETLFQA